MILNQQDHSLASPRRLPRGRSMRRPARSEGWGCRAISVGQMSLPVVLDREVDLLHEEMITTRIERTACSIYLLLSDLERLLRGHGGLTLSPHLRLHARIDNTRSHTEERHLIFLLGPTFAEPIHGRFGASIGNPCGVGVK